MDKEGPQIEQFESKGTAPNVVQLPVDWLGPRDKLVPFGPRDNRGTSTRSDQADPSADGLPTDGRSEDPAMPPSAADFWGERADAVQGVLQGPPSPARIRRELEPAPDRAEPAHKRRRPRLVRPRSLCLVAAGCLLVVAGAAAVISSVAGEHSLGRARGPAASAGTALKARLPQTVPAGVPAIPALIASPQHRASKARRAHIARRRTRTTRQPRHRVKQHPAATPVRYSAPAPGTSSAGASAPAQSSSSVVSAPPSTTGQSSSSSGSGSGDLAGGTNSASTSRTSSSASPTGAAGALGPIGSPNG